MLSPILSRRKWKLYAHNQHIVIVNGNQERLWHPLMKAYLWALYMPQYPNITVEARIGDKYKPDVVAFPPGIDPHLSAGKPVFWGEAGQVGKAKIESLVRRYRDTHFAIAKWDQRIDLLEEQVREALDGLDRSAPFDLIRFDSATAEGFIDDNGNITLSHDDLQWIRI